MNQPATHEQLAKEFKEILQPFHAEKIAGQCADIVVRERMKMLSNTVDHFDRMVDRVINPREKSIE